ncbi:MAG: SRPBCC domain-containing protein [Planctomycetota bacterium]
MSDLPHPLSRTVVIRAPREVVFRYFTDSARWARWWGKGSTIEGRVGGAVCIVYPNGVVVRGEVTAFTPGRGLAFTYGYESTEPELPVGSSLVTIALHDDDAGTRLELRHDLPGAKARDRHVPGWRFQLAQFANAVADEQHAGAAARIDAWFRAWAAPDDASCRELLLACATDDVTMQDRWSCIAGRDELIAHIAACRLHMPGVTTRRDGDVRHCQGTAVATWVATDATGIARGAGTNVVRFAPDGRIAAVVGLW